MTAGVRAPAAIVRHAFGTLSTWCAARWHRGLPRTHASPPHRSRCPRRERSPSG